MKDRAYLSTTISQGISYFLPLNVRKGHLQWNYCPLILIPASKPMANGNFTSWLLHRSLNLPLLYSLTSKFWHFSMNFKKITRKKTAFIFLNSGLEISPISTLSTQNASNSAFIPWNLIVKKCILSKSLETLGYPRWRFRYFTMLFTHWISPVVQFRRVCVPKFTWPWTSPTSHRADGYSITQGWKPLTTFWWKTKHSYQVEIEFIIVGGKYYKKWSTNILGISGQF